MWTMNITLSMDENLAARAREVAQAQGISLNELIRRHLESLTGKGSRTMLAARYAAFERPRAEAAPRTWRREDAYGERA